ncbi:hypothetical protein EVAR_5861_1 [Eumeta japonica]|uniref:Uncharacterized protein n=1 Tax=Eumeta variegata TaxID=151549 RepID=A0A4C1TEL9_EUMVA|nr:hypothetical protein EVAR_5861_1 [Eumeta japonica]
MRIKSDYSLHFRMGRRSSAAQVKTRCRAGGKKRSARRRMPARPWDQLPINDSHSSYGLAENNRCSVGRDPHVTIPIVILLMHLKCIECSSDEIFC